MKLVAKEKDGRLRFYGVGKPRGKQSGEIAIDIDQQVLQAVIAQSIAGASYLPLSGGTMTGDIASNTGSGVKFGTSTSQKIGFFNATPVDKPATVSDPSGGATVDAEARTAINALIDRLQELGLIA